MAGRYFYKGQDINNLIQPGGTTTLSGGSNFTNFPQIISSNVNSNFESVGHSNFGGFANAYKYKVGNTILPIGTTDQGINKIVSIYKDYTFNSAGAVQPINIPSGLTTAPNHITAIVIGGGGGRGGGGGYGLGGVGLITFGYSGGDGGLGGGSAYCYIEKIPYNGTMNVIVGGGGKGGNGGAKADPNFYNAGTDGNPGDPGGATILYMAGSAIVTSNGGNGGGKGGGGNTANDGGKGANGNGGSVSRNVNTNFILKSGSIELVSDNSWMGYKNEIVTTFANTNPTVPFLGNYGKGGYNGGNGGSYATGKYNNSANAGESGYHGFCRIYFLYI